MATQFSELAPDEYTLVRVQTTDDARKVLQNSEQSAVIVPTETLYEVMCPITASPSALNQLRPASERSIVCLGFHDFQALASLSDTEQSLLRVLTKELWPGPLRISAPSNGLLSGGAVALTDSSSMLSFTCPVTVEARLLKQLSSVPMVSTPAAMFSGVYCSSLPQVKFAYKYKSVQIVHRESAQNHCALGFDRTHICATGNTLRVLQKGMVTVKLLRTIIESQGLQNVKVVEETPGPSTPTPPVTQTLPPLRALCYAVHFMDCSEFPAFPADILEKTKEFLGKCVLVDFNALASKHRDQCLAYVDLSSTGDYKEALFNLYNIFYEVRHLPHTKMLFYNLQFISNRYNDVLWTKITALTQGKTIGIPFTFSSITTTTD